MVHKFPATLEDLRRRSETTPTSEIKFFKLVNTLNDDWYVWHSIRWNDDVRHQSGEADFLIFNAKYGYLVIEVKGGIITSENGNYYSVNTLTNEKNQLHKDPFIQAERTVHHIREFYIQSAKQEKNPSQLLKKNKYGFQFPLSFNFGVFYPDTSFKDNIQCIQYSNNKIFDKTDIKRQIQWIQKGKKGISPLENFFILCLASFR